MQCRPSGKTKRQGNGWRTREPRALSWSGRYLKQDAIEQRWCDSPPVVTDTAMQADLLHALEVLCSRRGVSLGVSTGGQGMAAIAVWTSSTREAEKDDHIRETNAVYRIHTAVQRQ